MKNYSPSWLLRIALLSVAMALSACGDGNGSSSSPAPTNSASSSDIAIASHQQGVTPFISLVQLRGSSLGSVTAARFTIAPKDGTVSKPVMAEYSIDALTRKGYVSSGTLTLPVFGLYAGHSNQVTILLSFADESAQSLSLDIPTAAYTDPNGIYDRPSVLKKRDAQSQLGFDFFFMKSALGTPVVVDTDGETRWVGTGVANSTSSTFHENGFIVGDQESRKIWRLELDGTISEMMLDWIPYSNFHHNIDPGKQGLLANLDGIINGVPNIESILSEISPTGKILNSWEFATLLGEYMRSQGDDPSTFIRPDADWLHLNAATYDPRDDSIIASSRENFIIKIGYQSGDVIWIFGDPTKYWYSFPSLRAKALLLEGDGLYPIGQHSTSITSDGLLMIFNNGAPSLNQPDGTPVGETRPYSAVSAYAIDQASRTVQELWRFDYGQSILSNYCSSAYDPEGKSILVNYAMASGATKTRLVGLDSGRSVVFDLEYPNEGCDTSWNAEPVHFENLTFKLPSAMQNCPVMSKSSSATPAHYFSCYR